MKTSSPTISLDAFLSAILGRPAPGRAAAFAAQILEYSPDQPRDERGRWTADGSSSSAIDEKPASEASARARELERVLPHRLEQLKQIAKETENKERFGVILKAKDPGAIPQYKFYECKSKDADESHSPFKWWGSDKMHGGLLPKPGTDGKIDLDAKGTLDPNYPIEFDWHTHPPTGDPWPSGVDGEISRKNDIPGVMLRYMGRTVRGKTEDDWAVWITDTDGKTYEYKPLERRTEH